MIKITMVGDKYISLSNRDSMYIKDWINAGHGEPNIGDEVERIDLPDNPHFPQVKFYGYQPCSKTK